MEARVNKVALPGYALKKIIALRKTTIIGPGLRRSSSCDVYVTKPGILRHKKPNVYWVETKQSTYYPKKGDFVVGVVTLKNCETYKVDVGAQDDAILSHFALEGTTKKMKKELAVGQTVFGKLLTARKEMQSEIVCINKFLKAKNMGVLVNGILADVAAFYAHKILNGRISDLRGNGSKFPFETAVGSNGNIWIRGRGPKDTLKLKTAVKNGKTNGIKNEKPNGIICKKTTGPRFLAFY